MLKEPIGFPGYTIKISFWSTNHFCIFGHWSSVLIDNGRDKIDDDDDDDGDQDKENHNQTFPLINCWKAFKPTKPNK